MLPDNTYISRQGILYLLLSLITVLFVSCRQSDNSVGLQSNPFDTDNKELLFTQMEAAVDSAFTATKRDYQASTLKGYLMWDSITYVLYSPDNFTHSSDLDWARHQNGIIEYLNWHLRKTIYPLLNERIVEELKLETTLTDSLLATQYKWLRSHFDTTQQSSGTSSYLKYHNIEKEMLEIQNMNLREILDALTDSNYTRPTPHKISAELLANECHHIQTERIPYYTNDSVYNEEVDRSDFTTEIATWSRLMKQRNNIASLLNGNVRTAFDIGTYRLTFNRLRQLKNEAYDIMSGDMRNNILPDTCTYDELLAYPNFSTKWKDYLIHLE